jgi:hypothetical protein
MREQYRGGVVMTIEELELELDKLSGSEKKQLLRRLIAALDEEQDEDAERLWLEEAQRRYKELKDGVVAAIPAEESIAKARDRLRNVR